MKEILTSTEDYVGYKLRLFPTKDQEKIFYEYFGMSKFVYNKTIDLQEEQYKKYIDYKENPDKYDDIVYKRLSAERIGVTFTKLKKDKYKWLCKYNSESIKGIIRDCCTGYNKSDDIKLKNLRPKYKNKASKKQFYVRHDRLSISDKYISISSIGKIKYCNSYGDEIIGDGNKDKKYSKYLHYSNPRISFDGINYYLSFSIPKDQKHQIQSYWKYYNTDWKYKNSSQPIGIDVGLKNEKWMVDSTGYILERPNNDSLYKKINRLQRKYDRQKNTNLKKNSSFMEQHPNGSKNMQKTLTKINKCFKKITNRRKNTVYEYSKRLLDLKPKTVVMETIHSNALIKSYSNLINHLVYDAALYESMYIIEQKMLNNGIPVIRADSDYPSSQLCSCCGYRQDIGRRKIYNCPNCGASINRDINAAINLAKLAY